MPEAKIFLSDAGFAWSLPRASAQWMSWRAQLREHNNVAQWRQHCCAELIAFLRKQARSRVQIELGGNWCHLQVVQYPKGLRSRERPTYLRSRLLAVYGANANNWHMIHEPSYLNRGFMLAAIEADLKETLIASFTAEKIRVAHMRPAFTQLFNRVRKSIKAAQGGFGIVEDTRLTLGIWNQGEWQLVRSQPVAHTDIDTVQSLLNQMGMQCAPMREPTLYLVASSPQVRLPQAARVGAWQLVNVEL